MTITITDPKMMADLESARDIIEFRDPQGKLLNVVTTRLPGTPPPEVLANVRLLTTEEYEERRKQPGQPLEEILAEFRAEGLCTK